MSIALPRRSGRRDQGAPTRFLSRAVAFAVAALLICAHNRSTASAQPAAPQFQDLPPGRWLPVAQQDGRALLLKAPDLRRGIPRPDTGRKGAQATQIETLDVSEIGTPAAGLALPRLSGVRGSLGRELVFRTVVWLGQPVFVSRPEEAPPLRRSPTNASVYAFEHAGHVWRFTGAEGSRRLTAETVQGFDLATLRAARTEESGPLLWAINPLWSRDGQWLAYTTNRNAVRSNTSGQEVWLIDVQSGTERPLLSTTGVTYVAVGWMERELLFRRDDQPGAVLAIDPVSGAVRRVTDGYPLAIADTGRSVAVLRGADVTDATIHIVRPQGTTDLPAPPAGHYFIAIAQPSPNGSAFLLMARTLEGAHQIGVFRIATGQIEWTPLEGVPARRALTDPPRWVTNARVLLNFADRRTGAAQAQLLGIPTP